MKSLDIQPVSEYKYWQAQLQKSAIDQSILKHWIHHLNGELASSTLYLRQDIPLSSYFWMSSIKITD